MNAQKWHTNFEEAKEIATKENKKIILVFSGSDWCKPGMKLEDTVWNSETFKYYATDNYVLIKVDFPKRKKNQLSPSATKYNNVLAKEYNPKGYFPLVAVLESDGQVLGKTGYIKTCLLYTSPSPRDRG